jgi:peptide/nickel transport system substrate-binding protein
MALAAVASPANAQGPTRDASTVPPFRLGNNHGALTDTFNPFSTGGSTAATAASGELDLIYETLLYTNQFQPGKYFPWLATSYQFSNGGRTLAFQIHHNVTWSDGTPFTAADVAFTFNLLKRYPAINVNGIMPNSITVNNSYEVTMKFATPQYVNLYLIGDTPIVPEHIWSSVASPVTYPDSHPVGTGPFTLSSFSPTSIIFVKNPHYWQPGLPKVTTIEDESFDTDASADLAIEHNQLEQMVAPLADYQKLYVDPDPTNHIVYYPVSNQLESLMVNLKVYPFNLVAVRQAISDAINRNILSVDGESSQFPPDLTPTGLILPIDNNYMDPAYRSLALDPTSNLSAAKKVLLGAGFSYKGSQLIMPNGKPFTATIIDPSPYSDYVLDSSILGEQLRTLGINVTVNNESLGSWSADATDGNFDILVSYSYAAGPTPYYMLNAELNSALTAPIGSPASGDIERFDSAQADALLANYRDTGSLSQQIKDIQGLETIMVKEVPLIMLFDQTDGYPINTTYYTGFVTQSNQYADPLSEQVILHVTPRG